MPKDEKVEPYGSEKKFETPMRVHSVIASDTGFYPDSIMLFKGEKLKLFVTGTKTQPSCLMIPGKNLFLSAEKGIISEGEVLFDQVGIYEFFCPSSRNFKGKIVVMEKKVETEKVKREIASKNRVGKHWYPKDDDAMILE